MLQSIFVFQESRGDARRKTTWSNRRKDAEQRTTSWDPPKRVLEDLGTQPATDKIANRQRGEGAIGVEIGAQHRAASPDACIGERHLKPRRWQVDDRDRVANQRQRRTHALERLGLVRDGKVAGLPTRGGARIRKVNGEPLLQFARARRGDQGRTRRPAADVDQQPGPV